MSLWWVRLRNSALNYTSSGMVGDSLAINIVLSFDKRCLIVIIAKKSRLVLLVMGSNVNTLRARSFLPEDLISTNVYMYVRVLLSRFCYPYHTHIALKEPHAAMSH